MESWGDCVLEKYQTIIGKDIIVLERLLEWESQSVFYKIKWGDGTENIINENELQRIKIDEKQLVNETIALTSEEKFQLYFKYFRGRPDIYAVKWQNMEGKTGFSPHAKGEWVQEKSKNQIRNKFEVHSYYPYTLQTIENHIRGTEREFRFGTGIYPMLTDDTTYLVVIDFDNEMAFETVKPVIEVCKKYNLTPLIELSQSGQGIHVWFFFEKNIPAKIARRFANLILRHAMAEHPTINFSSFDRIIPMQDTLPSKGFGNIIALPLKAQKVLEGKNIFLNNQLEPVLNMWQQLAQTVRYSQQEVLDFIQILEKNLPIQLFNQKIELNEHFTTLDIKLNVVSRGELVIDKQALTRKQLIQLSHLATFRNPEFYKRQKMRMPTWNIPQYITAAREDECFLYLPRGLQESLKDYVQQLKVDKEHSDGRAIEVSFIGDLRHEQARAEREMMHHSTGIISARTGFGKTILSASVIAKKKVSCLILVHNKILADQWEQRLNDFLIIETQPVVEYTKTGKIRKKPRIGRLGGGRNVLTEVIDVALFQSLSGRDDLANFFSKYGMIIVDEAHHIAAQSFEEVIRFANASYLYGLTATPERKDGLTPLLFMRLGHVIYENQDESEDALLTPQFFYPRFTNYGEFNSDTVYHEHIQHLTKHSERNQLIIRDIIDNIQGNRTCLVLTERIEHIDEIYNLLSKEKPDFNIFKLKSQQSKKENQKFIDKMNLLQEPFIVIATGKFVGEGFDLKQLESIFFCLPFSWKGSTKQYLGRLQRDVSNKSELRIYDYIDASVNMFTKMYYKRQKEYIRLGYQLAEDQQTRSIQTQLYNGRNYLTILLNDSLKSRNIFLSIPHFNQTVVSQLEKLRLDGKQIVVVCKNPIKENGLVNQRAQTYIKRLKELGIACILLQNTPQPFVILDKGLIWYGDLNFYTVNDTNKNSIRIVNMSLAKKLIQQYT